VDRGEAASLLKSWALEAGFDLAGVAALEPSAHGEAFRRWLERGNHAGMEYMARRVELRLEPAAVLPGARSALCVALRYAPHVDEAAIEGDLWPRVARYARGRDYHDVMTERLAALARRVEAAFSGVKTRAYVDTGPLLERELAARAGLGAVGKNTMLLHPGHGSYFLLGELLLTLDLAPDLPLADLCGSCTRCLEACPTGALAEPYRLDSARCLSYWTIEHRGSFPAAAAELVTEGGWVFGCDICQEVCPWNAAPIPVADPDFAVPAPRRGLRLADLVEMSREGYVDLFRGSPLKRAKLDGLRRNAAAVRPAAQDLP
jgi:epoxyqueuosine reductase